MKVFEARKGLQKVVVSVPSRPHRRPQGYDPVPGDRVVGVDTETWEDRSGRLVTALVMVAGPWGVDVADTRSMDGDRLRVVLDIVFPLYSGQDKPIVVAFYNLEYDLGRLLEPKSLFWDKLRLGLSSFVFSCGPYAVEVRGIVPRGSAPSFDWIVRRGDAKVRFVGRDLWGYWKGGLDKSCRAVGLGGKVNLDKALFARKLEEITEEEWAQIRRYAGEDARLTRDLYLRTAELLGSVDRPVADRPAAVRKGGILPPSAPAAAARMLLARARVEKWPRVPPVVEQAALRAYYGGRVFALRKGKVPLAAQLDINSAYPCAMAALPDPCTASWQGAKGTWRDPRPEELPAWGFALVDGEEVDALYPSLFGEIRGKIMPVVGPFSDIWTTLPELRAGIADGRLRNVVVREMYWVENWEEPSLFASYVRDMFFLKAQAKAEKNEALYQIAKLCLNAPYGKLIELQLPEAVIVPEGEDWLELLATPVPCYEPGREPKGYVRQLFRFVEARDVDGLLAYLAELPEAGRLGEVPMDRYLSGERLAGGEILREARAGAFFAPAWASLITGLTRARLGVMARCTRAVLGDTDSLFVPEGINWEAGLARADAVLTRLGYPGARLGEGLGELSCELREGVLLVDGIKRYAVRGIDPRTGAVRVKVAHHGLPGLPNDQAEELLERLAAGAEAPYQARARPVKIRSALRGLGEAGRFEARVVAAKSKADARLVPDGDGGLCWRPWHEAQAAVSTREAADRSGAARLLRKAEEEKERAAWRYDRAQREAMRKYRRELARRILENGGIKDTGDYAWLPRHLVRKRATCSLDDLADILGFRSEAEMYERLVALYGRKDRM